MLSLYEKSGYQLPRILYKPSSVNKVLTKENCQFAVSALKNYKASFERESTSYSRIFIPRALPLSYPKIAVDAFNFTRYMRVIIKNDKELLKIAVCTFQGAISLVYQASALKLCITIAVCTLQSTVESSVLT